VREGRGNVTAVIKRDSFDVRAFKHVRMSAPELEDVSQATGEDFTGDIFSSLYKLAPELDASANATHKPIIDSMMGTSDWAKFRETTRLNETASALATIQLADKLAPELKRQQDEDTLRQTIRRAIRQTSADVSEQMDAFASLTAGTGKGDGSPGNPADVAAIFGKLRNSRLLRDIAKLAGRMRQIAMRKHTDRVRHGPDELTDVEQGRELGRVLPSELTLLDSEDTEMEFFRRYAEGSLLQYRLEGRETKGKGPIILCLDSSGSMRDDPRREIWAKALALGLMTVAALERREFSLIHFGSVSELRRVDFGRNPPADKILDEMAFFFNGGTSFDRAITEAITVAEGSAYRQADVIFLTDGASSVSPEVADKLSELKARIGLKFYSVLIGTNSQALNAISEGVSRIDDLSKDADTLDLVFGV
jgi:uncharacterized protein with von Willebrand factor type A (vWA) domain